MYPSFKYHNYFQLRMACDCCGTVEVFSLSQWPSWDIWGHDSANPTREVNFKECGRDTRKTNPTLNASLKPFVTEWSRDPPHPPGRAPGTNGFVKGVTELHCGNCRSLTLLKQRRSKSLGGPFWNVALHQIRPAPTTSYIFAPFFFFPFLFSHPLNSPSWQHSAFPTDDDVEDDDDCHGNARRVQRRMWEEWDGDGKRAAVHSVELFQKPTPVAIDFFNLHSLTSLRRPTKFGRFTVTFECDSQSGKKI